eukprot:1774789-Pyramimonas_sp.AAC.1
MLLKPPPDGPEGAPDGGALVARMPVYGTRDARRGLWKEIRKGLKLMVYMRIVACPLCSAFAMARMRTQFDTREVKSDNFRYWVLEVVQDENFT